MNKEIAQTIDQINEKLSNIQEHMAWMILAHQRFSIGMRVEWSEKARKAGFPRRKCAQRGTVKAIDGFTIVVKLDGLKKPTSYHHAWFNPAKGPRLF
jgi:hypothetical protein